MVYSDPRTASWASIERLPASTRAKEPRDPCNGSIEQWFEVATTALLAVIAINTMDRRWNNSTLVEQVNDIIRSFSSLARQDAASRRNTRP